MGENKLQIAVLSGKGGTGKTFLAVNLAAAMQDVTYLDCDVEEPNGHLFFKPELDCTEDVLVKVPVVEEAKCNGCRQCVEFCQFNALAYINQNLLIFTQLCHSCGGCVLVCPTKALTEEDKAVGQIRGGSYKNVRVLTGVMNPGEESGVPIIQQLLTHVTQSQNPVIIDCPAGSGCTVMESIKNADYCVLVTEPTPLSIHNLGMIHQLVTLMKKPCGVVINKHLEASDSVEDFCRNNKIPILTRIGFDLKLAEIGAQGLIAVEESQQYKKIFTQLAEDISKEISHETTVDHQR